jgi:hypothetical protein
MKQLYADIISGRTVFPAAGAQYQITVANNLEIPIVVSYIGSDNRFYGNWSIAAGKTQAIDNVWDGLQFVCTNQLSGSFAAGFACSSASPTVTISDDDLTRPNYIGEVPQPNTEMMIPTNTPRITVGVSVAPNGNFVVHEQYWQKMPDSFTLIPGEQETVSVTTTSGKQSTSSTSEEMAVSLGMSAKAGWGPVSSSVSASLSAGASAFQQVTVSEQTQTYRSKVLHNKSTDVQLYLVWQLTDVVTVFDAKTKAALTSLISVESPSIVGGPYNPSNLPKPPTNLALKSAGVPLPTAVQQ